MFGKSSKEASDADLVAQCNAAEPGRAATAFTTLYKRHRDYVLRIALRFARDPELAAEALQETFTYLLRQFPPPGDGLTLTAQLRTYLYPIAKNAAITALRKATRFESAIDDPDLLPAPQTTATDNDAIDAALAGLPAAQREVLQLRFVDGYALDEIAAALQVPLGTVKSRLHNAVRQLRTDPKIKDLFEQ